MAIALGSRRGRLSSAAAAGGVVAAGAVCAAMLFSAQMQRPDWRTAAAAIGPPSGPTALLVMRNADAPLAYYQEAQYFNPRFFPHGVTVREIDVVSRTGAVTPPVDGFRLAEQRGMSPCCALRRYVSKRPVHIRPSDLADAHLGEPYTAMLTGVAPVVIGDHESGPA